MYLLVVAMCEKWRSSHFQSEGGEGVKKLRTGWSEFKHLRPGGGGELPIWGGYFCWGGRYPITCIWNEYIWNEYIFITYIYL